MPFSVSNYSQNSAAYFFHYDYRVSGVFFTDYLWLGKYMYMGKPKCTTRTFSCSRSLPLPCLICMTVTVMAKRKTLYGNNREIVTIAIVLCFCISLLLDYSRVLDHRQVSQLVVITPVTVLPCTCSPPQRSGPKCPPVWPLHNT